MDFLDKLEKLFSIRTDWIDHIIYESWSNTDSRIVNLLVEFGWAEQGVFCRFTKAGGTILDELHDFILDLLDEMRH